MARFRDHVQHLLKELVLITLLRFLLLILAHDVTRKGGETVIESYRQRSLWAYTIQGLKYVLPAKASK